MTVMLVALILSDSTLIASDYRLVEDQQVDPRFEPRPRPREWKPGVDGWTIENKDCAVFFRRDVAGAGLLTVGPRCEDEEIPYAL